MKNLKKLIAVVLTFTLVFSAMAVGFAGTFSDVKDDAPYASAVARLQQLGLVSGMPDGTYQPDGAVTRAQMIAFVNAAEGLQQAAQLAVGPTKFSDVPASYWASGDINIADPSGYPDGTFKPNNTVTYPEALAMILRALGYTANYSWPYGVIAKATNVGITNGVTLSANATITRGQMAMLVNNALDLDINKYVDGAESDTGTKLLSKVANVTRYLVLATHDVDSSVDSGKVLVEGISKVDDTTGVITFKNSTTINAGKTVDFNKYVGKLVDVYTLKNGDPVSVDVVSIDKTFTAKSFNVVSNSVYNDDSKVVDIANNDIPVVYNGGKTTLSKLTGNYKVYDGATVTLTDTNNDGKYDFMVVSDAYRTPVKVNKDITSNDKFINSTSSLRIAGDPVKTVIVKGAVDKLTDIKANDVVYYASTVDGSKVTLLVARNTVQGKVTKVSFDGSKTVATIGDKDYEVVNYINTNTTGAKASIDQEGTFILDKDGKIVEFVGKQATANYAVVIDQAGVGTLNGKVKLLTADGNTNVYATTASSVYANDSLVTYTLDSNNVVTALNSPLIATGDSLVTGGNPAGYSYNKDTHVLTLGQNYYLTDNTVIFNKNASGSTPSYATVKLSDITASTLHVSSLVADKYGYVKAIYLNEPTLTSDNGVETTVYGYIKGVTTVYVGSDTKYTLDVFANGSEQTYTTKANLSGVPTLNGGYDYVYAIGLDKNGVVVSLNQVTGASNVIGSVYVTDVNANGITVSDGTTTTPYALSANVTVVTKDSNGKYNVLAGLGDIVKGTSASNASNVALYKDASGRVAVIVIK